MICSWLSMVNNDGLVMLSVNRRRYSAGLLESNRCFSLSVPTEVMEETVLKIGKLSGRFVDKFHEIQDLELEKHDDFSYVRGTVATLECNVVSIDTRVDPAHFVVFAKIEKAVIDSRYWNGKHFMRTRTDLPSILTFLGSQKFAHVKE
mmetsp:Transcript_15421/g.24128  ORF Transcript_15421/g.24128 Transcript_15421/m.24128 type:complete len:148 (-) Transcript_15421:1264-1707(-)